MSSRDSRDRLLYRFLDQHTNSRNIVGQARRDAVTLNPLDRRIREDDPTGLSR